MGFLDIFKKKENNVQKPNIRLQMEQKPFDIKLRATNDGRLQVDFYDRESEFKNFYDTTRLIVSGIPLNIGGKDVYNCMVSWYGESDCQMMIDKATKEMSSLRAIDYREVLAEIDLDLLQTDTKYCEKLMKGLLNKSRVESYLENGLQEMPQRPCGQYIGGLRQTEDGYKKIFDAYIGRKSHNSSQMVEKRRERRKQIEDIKRRQIDDKKAQIRKLQAELDDMHR